MDWGAFAIACLPAAASFAGVYFSNRKQAALMDYRLQQLEKKVGAHNNLEGRVIVLETKMNDMDHSA